MDVLIYGICLGVGLLFTIISAVAGHLFGGDHGDLGTGGHAEAGFDDAGVPGVSLFSPTSIACFLTAFGALGLIFSKIKVTSHPLVSGMLSAVGAVGIAVVVFWMFSKVFGHAESSSEAHVATLAGQSATIITPIPENGVGEIAYVQSGTRYTAPARHEKGTAVANGRLVKITRIVGTQFYVTEEQPSESAVKPT
jgi:membrane protein implicated in regulation of membrane protease activity